MISAQSVSSYIMSLLLAYFKVIWLIKLDSKLKSPVGFCHGYGPDLQRTDRCSRILSVRTLETCVRSGSAGRGIEFLRPVAMAPTLCGTARQSPISLTQSLRHQRTPPVGLYRSLLVFDEMPIPQGAALAVVPIENTLSSNKGDFDDVVVLLFKP